MPSNKLENKVIGQHERVINKQRRITEQYIRRLARFIFKQSVLNSNAGSDLDKFMVLNTSDHKLYFRTGANVLSDIGAAASSHVHDHIEDDTSVYMEVNSVTKFSADADGLYLEDNSLFFGTSNSGNYLYGAGGGFWDGLYDAVVVVGVDGGELSIDGDDWMLHWDSTEVNINGHLEVDDYLYYDDTQTVDITGEGTTYSLTPTKACIRITGTRDAGGCTLTLQTATTTPYNTPTYIFNDCGDIVNIAGRAQTPQLYDSAMVVAIRNASGWCINRY